MQFVFFLTSLKDLLHSFCFCGVMVSELDSGLSGLVRALAGDMALCPWARHLTATVPLSTQVYNGYLLI